MTAACDAEVYDDDGFCRWCEQHTDDPTGHRSTCRRTRRRPADEAPPTGPDGTPKRVPPTASEALAERFGLLSREQLAELPPVEPLIDGTLDRRTLAVLAGYWGTGKSFVALDWACCVATGKPWQSRPIVAEPGRVLYVVAEGAYGVHGRITAWERAWGEQVERLDVVPTALNLMGRGDAELVAGYVAERHVDLVIIDTLSRCMTGADENSAQDMSSAVRSLDRIRAAGPGTCVLVVHHTGKDRTTIRGSSVLEGAADTVYQVEGDAYAMRLVRTKRKDGPRDDTHQLGVRAVPGTPSAVVSAHSEQFPSHDRLLSVFVSAFSATGASQADLRKVADMAPATFHRAVNRLVTAGELVNTGTDKRPFYMRATA